MRKYRLGTVLNVRLLATEGKLRTSKKFVRMPLTATEHMTVLRSEIPTHPGVILATRILTPLNLPVIGAAHRIGIRTPVLKRLIHGQLSMTVSLAHLLQKAFQIDAKVWLDLQRAHDLGKRGLRTARVRFRRPITFYHERARLQERGSLINPGEIG
jgi:antitoxin HigA-1